MDIQNATIESTMLGVEDHGIFTYSIGLNYGGSGQTFGGYGLDSYDKATKRRVGTAYGLEAIARLLRVVGVSKWEDLKGKPVRVVADYSKVYKLGNYLKDEWLDLHALAGEYLSR